MLKRLVKTLEIKMSVFTFLTLVLITPKVIASGGGSTDPWPWAEVKLQDHLPGTWVAKSGDSKFFFDFKIMSRDEKASVWGVRVDRINNMIDRKVISTFIGYVDLSQSEFVGKAIQNQAITLMSVKAFDRDESLISDVVFGMTMVRLTHPKKAPLIRKLTLEKVR